MSAAYDVSERAFQSAVIDVAQAFGFITGHHHDSRRQVRPGVFVGDQDAAGFPDLCIAGHGIVCFAEIKSSKGRLSPAQEQWRTVLEGVEAAGSQVRYRLWRPADWTTAERELRAWAKR